MPKLRSTPITQLHIALELELLVRALELRCPALAGVGGEEVGAGVLGVVGFVETEVGGCEDEAHVVCS